MNQKLELDLIPLVIYVDVVKNWVQKQDTLVTCPVSVCFHYGINSHFLSVIILFWVFFTSPHILHVQKTDIFRRTLEHNVILFQAGLKCQRSAQP